LGCLVWTSIFAVCFGVIQACVFYVVFGISCGFPGFWVFRALICWFYYFSGFIGACVCFGFGGFGYFARILLFSGFVCLGRYNTDFWWFWCCIIVLWVVCGSFGGFWGISGFVLCGLGIFEFGFLWFLVVFGVLGILFVFDVFREFRGVWGWYNTDFAVMR